MLTYIFFLIQLLVYALCIELDLFFNCNVKQIHRIYHRKKYNTRAFQLSSQNLHECNDKTLNLQNEVIRNDDEH